MPARKFARVGLPKGIFRVTRGAKEYYYHQIGRHLPKAERGKLTRIPYEPTSPNFWAMAEDLNGGQIRIARGTFSAVIASYRSSPTWASLTDGTRETYGVYLDRISRAWGGLPVDDLTLAGITTLRDEMAATAPSAANMMLKVLKAFLGWAVDKGECSRNPSREVKPLDVEVRKAVPWPEEVWSAAVKGPDDIARLAMLGRRSGQRISDIVRMGPETLKDGALHITIKKRRMKTHIIPLLPEDEAIIAGWKGTPWVTKADGSEHDEQSLRNALYKWLASALKGVDTSEVAPHGLRAMAVCDARIDGLSHQEIANLFGMSAAMVMRYSENIDQELMARTTQGRRLPRKTKAVDPQTQD